MLLKSESHINCYHHRANMKKYYFSVLTILVFNIHSSTTQPPAPFDVLNKMLDDLQVQIANVDKSLDDVLSEMPNQGSIRNPIYLFVQMLRDNIGKYVVNKTDQSLHSLDNQILSIKSDAETGELIVANLLLFNQVRLDPKLSAAFHQVQFSMRALLYHINTVAQFLYNIWQTHPKQG